MDGAQPGAFPYVRNAAARPLIEPDMTQPMEREALMRARNLRTGLVLASIALAFFIGVVLKYTVFR